MVTIRRVRLSHDIWSGVTVAFDWISGEAVVTSVIGFSLLPLATREGEIAEQRGGDEERDHRHRDRSTFTQFAARDAALEGQRCHQMGRVQRTAARDRVN